MEERARRKIGSLGASHTQFFYKEGGTVPLSDCLPGFTLMCIKSTAWVEPQFLDASEEEIIKLA
jgi:hypothetical protein